MTLQTEKKTPIDTKIEISLSISNRTVRKKIDKGMCLRKILNLDWQWQIGNRAQASSGSDMQIARRPAIERLASRDAKKSRRAGGATRRAAGWTAESIDRSSSLTGLLSVTCD